ncbi:MAG: DUF3426 domain-containing protein [Methylococcales bacterium]|nr:DUF3426 domain-containing protein [Methylococcales bacterium]
MLTHCQHCKKTYSTDVEILCHPHRDRLCSHCEEMLGKLKRLGDDFLVLGQPRKVYQQERFWSWKLGVWLCSIALATQIYMFEKDRIIQNSQVRIWLEKICDSLTCQLPIYKNSDDFEVMFGNFQQTQHQYYIFQAVISNQGLFEQQYPHIKLNLLTLSGKSFAQRVFSPQEYMGKNPHKLIASSKTIEVSMKIAKPEQVVGGYTFELI